MEYTRLTPKDLAELRAERVTVLEGEHYRLSLLLAESQESPDSIMQLVAQMAEIERRIDLHSSPEAPDDVQAEIAARRRDAHQGRIAELASQADAIERTS
jgi:hypothetical protein